MGPNGFNGASHMHIDNAHHAYHHGLHRNGGEERDSISSDDGNYPPYSDAMKYENDISEDDNSSLISQTLNTDGTPKRPMNAFMIFARRRRPQVSAENQAMRTGEISKILSKEWNAMPPTEKQFYQDQARQLKDTFNSKYPDYVYRRRPNHSRRPRRKHDGSGDPQNCSSTSDDFGLDDSAESPTETRDLKALDQFSNLHTAMSTGVGDPSDIPKFPFGNARADYAYPTPQPPYQSNDPSSKPFGPTSLEIGPSSAMSGTGHLNNQGRPSSSYSENGSSSSSWGLPSMRPSSSPSSWVGGDVNRSYQPIGTPKSAQLAAGWPRPPSSLSPSSPSGYGLQQMLGNEAAHNTTSHSSTTPSYPSPGIPSGTFYGSRQYENQGHTMVHPTASPSGHYQNGSYREPTHYFSRNPQELPSISNYSVHSTSYSGTNHIHGNWTRD